MAMGVAEIVQNSPFIFISSFPSPSTFPPKPSISKPRALHFNVSRRDIALLSFLSWPSHASAFSIGISGPKDWLKEQKKKSSRFLLAPIDASRKILRSAYQLLTRSNSGGEDGELEEVQKLLKAAARDCVPQDRNSFVSFQANTGVEVCTFRLILKNASSLLGNKDPVKLKAEAKLDDLIRSFSSVSGLASGTISVLPSNRNKIADAVMDTILSLDKFERGIKDCLEI